MPVITILATHEWAVPDDPDFDPIDPKRGTPQQRLTYALGRALTQIVPALLTQRFNHNTTVKDVTVRFQTRNRHDINVQSLWITVAPMRDENLVISKFRLREMLIERVIGYFKTRISDCENPDFDIDITFDEGAGASVHNGRISATWS